jgi:hypothetical protein
VHHATERYCFIANAHKNNLTIFSLLPEFRSLSSREELKRCLFKRGDFKERARGTRKLLN